MVEGLPLTLLGYGSGWAIVCLVVVMIFRGNLVTRREATAKDKQIDALTEQNAVKDQTIAEFKDNIATSNLLIKAVLDVAQERNT